MGSQDAPPEAETASRRHPARWLILVVGVVCALATGAILVTVLSDETDSNCSDLRKEIARIEREVPVDAAHAWDDIYELQQAIQQRDNLRVQLRAEGCD